VRRLTVITGGTRTRGIGAAGAVRLAAFEGVDGRLSGVVSNAGATLHTGDLAETPAEVVRQVVDLNLTAAILVARRADQLLGRVGEPEEDAEAVSWLMYDACPYATGATLRVAGGR
jgi:NAD(P)-dependent dehydrogenase (short-subunit alcohol dehydrogenase family)